MTQWRISRRAWWAVLVGLLTLVAGIVAGEAAGAGAEPATIRRVEVESGAAYTDVNAAGLAAILRAKAFPLINVHIRACECARSPRAAGTDPGPRRERG